MTETEQSDNFQRHPGTDQNAFARRRRVPSQLVVIALVLIVAASIAFMVYQSAFAPTKLLGYFGLVRQIQFNSDGSLVFAAGTGGIAVWRPSQNTQPKIVFDEGVQYSSLAIPPSGKLVAAVNDKDGHIWDPDGAHVLDFSTAMPDCDRFLSPSFSHDGASLAVSCREKTSKKWRIKILDLTTMRPRQELEAPPGQLLDWIDFAHDDQWLVSYGSAVVDPQKKDHTFPGHVIIWDCANGQVLRSTFSYGDGFRCAAVIGSGQAIVVSMYRSAQVWLDTNDLEKTSDFSTDGFAILTPDRHSLIAPHWSNGLQRFDLETGAVNVLIPSHGALSGLYHLNRDAVALSSDGSCVAQVARLVENTSQPESKLQMQNLLDDRQSRCKVLVVDARTGSSVRSIAVDSPVSALAFHPVLNTLAAADAKGVLWLFPIQ